MPDPDHYDLIVLGGGMAGLPVGMKAAYPGMETALVEEELLGGTCLNPGCIPTKTMIRSAEVAHLARRSEEFGTTLDDTVEADMNAIVQRKDDVVESIREEAYTNVADNENLALVEDHGRFESAHELRVGNRLVATDRIVIGDVSGPPRTRRLPQTGYGR